MEEDEDQDELTINEPSSEANNPKSSSSNLEGTMSPRAALLAKLKNSKARLDTVLPPTPSNNTQASTPSISLDNTPLTYDELTQLSNLLAELPSTKLARVIVFIQTRTPSTAKQVNDEIEVDLDAIDAVTLRIIEKHLKTDNLSSLTSTADDTETGRGKRKKKKTEKVKEQDKETPKKRKKATSSTPKSTIDKKAVAILKKWAREHKDNIFPTTEEKEQLEKETNLPAAQITTWFMNYKRKKEKPKSRQDRIEQMAAEAAQAALSYPSGNITEEPAVSSSDMQVNSVTKASTFSVTDEEENNYTDESEEENKER